MTDYDAEADRASNRLNVFLQQYAGGPITDGVLREAEGIFREFFSAVTVSVQRLEDAKVRAQGTLSGLRAMNAEHRAEMLRSPRPQRDFPGFGRTR